MGRVPGSSAAGLIDLAELEHYAAELRVALVIHIPALLQTTDHARALFRAVFPPLQQYEIEHRLTHRIKRQGILHRDDPPTPLHRHHPRGGAPDGVRRPGRGRRPAQAPCRHERAAARHDPCDPPLRQSELPRTGQGIDYVAGAVPPQLDTVQLDTHHGCEFLDAEAQLKKYRAVVDHMEASALSPEASRDLIHRIAQEL